MHRTTDRPPGDDGFTLIELLVVIIIIGILAAIAVPLFLNQRKKGYDASMKNDLQEVAQNEETYFVDHQVYLPLAGSAPAYTLGAGADQVVIRSSPGNTITVTPDQYGVGTYCIVAANPSGTQSWVYRSSGGGMQGIGVTTC